MRKPSKTGPWLGGHGLPALAALTVAAFVAVLALAYVDALADEGIAYSKWQVIGGSIASAAIFGVATYLVTAMPARDRRTAEKIEEGLRDRELHLQQLLSVAPVMMFRTDHEGKLLMLEGAGVTDEMRANGFDVGSNLLALGKESDDWVDFAKRALAGETIDAVITTGGKNWEIHYQPWTASDGSTGMLGIATDVTERRKLEEEQKLDAEKEEEMNRLREMNEMKTTLLNTAAHELNTPLTPIRLQLHLLKSSTMGELSERQQRALGILDRSVLRLSGLVDDILDVARVQSGKLKVEPKPTNMRPLLEEVVDTFKETANQTGLTLELEAGPEIAVQGDNSRIAQVLTNLASNSIKYTPEGGQIKVKLSQEGSAAKITFADTGRGLSDEQMRLLFQPFSQVHDTKSVTARGSGLGLYICKGIIERHGGTIGVTSDGPGQGSEFYFTLPLASGKVVDAPAQVEVKQAEEGKMEAPPTPMAARLRGLI